VDERYRKRLLTKEKRKLQVCKVYVAKFDRSHLSSCVLTHLDSLFREGKWFYNYCVGKNDINDADTKARQVPVKVGEEYQDRKLSVLQAQMRRGIQARLCANLASLHSLKRNGRKVGRLKFKSQLNFIPLNQYNKTYFIRDGKVRIQGLKQRLRLPAIA